jgi:intracellular multiplication protein IcmB
MSVFNTVDNIMYNLGEIVGRPVDRHCRLETTVGNNTLIAQDASMATVLELGGLLKMAGVNEFNQLVRSLKTALASRMSTSGHAMQVVVQGDPEQTDDDIMGAIDPSRITAKKLGMDMRSTNSIMDDWAHSLSNYCCSEKVWFVLWTRPFKLSKVEAKTAGKRLAKTIPEATYGKGMQEVGKIMTAIQDDHESFVSAVVDAFKNQSMSIRVYDCQEALWWIRNSVDSPWTDKKWKARIPGTKYGMKLPEPDEEENIMSMFYPSLAKQVFPRDAEDIGDKFLCVGDKIHAPMIMELGPQDPRPFQVLFRELKGKKLPWRISFLIEPDGLKSLTWKSVLASVLAVTSSVNRQFNKAKKELEKQALNGEHILRLRVCFDTWIDAPGNMDDADALNDSLSRLKNRASQLASKIQGWGACDTGETVGAPLLGFSATVPAMMPSSPAPSTAAPINDVLTMLPITRPASPWRDGSVLLRSPDGKVWPYAQGSSKQAAWISIGFAPMGSGKSVWLNTTNFGFLTMAGLSRLPWLSIIDIGPSSKGLVSLMQAMFPAHMKHLFAYYRLRMEPEYAYNPFDTPLGSRKPLPAQKTFLVNLLSLFATPLDANAPQDGIPGIARAVIEEAYDEFSDERNAKSYTEGIDEEVDEVIKSLGIVTDELTSWWEIVDELYDAGHIREAILAQRYAVPLLADVAGFARRDKITSMYKHTTPGGEPISGFFWRSCIEAISSYPILKEPTRFDIGEAQVVSLDLDEVAPKGGPTAQRQSGVMFMLAREILAGRFFMMPEDVKHFPERYKRYHGERINKLRQDPKKLCVDEFHRASKGGGPVVEQFIGDIKTAARESRKWNLFIDLYSQDEGDFPEELVELAFSIFILGRGTEEGIDRLVKKFGLNPAARYAVSKLTKPGRAGSEMVALFKTDEGMVIQNLMSTIGQQMLWAFSSTTEDTQVRNALYERLGVGTTLGILGELYPGTIKPEVERRKQQASEDSRDVIEELIDEIESIARKEKAA